MIKKTIALILFILMANQVSLSYHDYNNDYNNTDKNTINPIDNNAITTRIPTNQIEYENKGYNDINTTTNIKNDINYNTNQNNYEPKNTTIITDQTPNNKIYTYENIKDIDNNKIKKEQCPNKDKNCTNYIYDINSLKLQTDDKNYQKISNLKENYNYDKDYNITKDEDKNYFFVKMIIDKTPFIKVIDKNDKSYEPTEKEYYLFGKEKIKIRKEDDYNYIISNGAAAKSNAEIISSENKLIAKKENKEYEINFSPIQAYNKNKVIPTAPALLEIKENNATYLLKGKKSGKILGLVWTEYEIKIIMDATTGKVLEETKPFWSFLVIDT